MKQATLAPLFAVPFAAQAGNNTITQIPQASTAIGRASMALGFPASCMTPLAAGGNPPYGQDLNGILNMLSVAAQASELGMMRSFSASYAATIGGYPTGSTVAHPTITGRYLMCAQDGNSNDPSQNMDGWLDPMAAFQPAGNYQSAGDYALNKDLKNEIQRAEQAEADLVPYSAFSGNLSDWGYCRLPNGLILQWGNVGGYNPVSTLVETAPINGVCSFPVTFPKRCFSLTLGNTSTQGGAADAAFGYPLNNSQFYAQTWAGHLSQFGMSFIAIGM